MTEVATLPILYEACETCPAHHAANLQRLGIDLDNVDYVLALAGNPNVGKSTVFNALTGLRQHTGNWPGKTVARAEGGYAYRDQHYKLVDLPGTYSLLATSPDEEIARDFILFGQPDATIVVVDANRLERNLNLVLQLLAITPRVVLCLNLIDEAERHGLQIDERGLARRLGVPVVPTSARYGRGMEELLSAIHDVVHGAVRPRVDNVSIIPVDLRPAVDWLAGQIEDLYPGLPNTRWLALRLLDGDASIKNAMVSGQLSKLNLLGGQKSAQAGAVGVIS
jgi:ferrous iron transport protein B